MIKKLCNVRNVASESNAANLRRKQWGRRENASNGIIDLEPLEGLQPHENLKQLMIYGYGGVSFSMWMNNMGSCLPNLTKVIISDCKILSGCLPPLSQLPYLKSLHLYDFPVLEYIDLEFAESAATALFFPALKELKLVCFSNLKGWWKANKYSHLTFLVFPNISENAQISFLFHLLHLLKNWT